jgi:diadenylate cyclase
MPQGVFFLGETIFDYLSQLILSIRSMSGITISDVVDILIMTFLIYKVMLWMRETRTWALLRGFMFFSGAYALALLLQLSTLTWLIKNTYNVGLIAIIVIFQPELRKMLEQIGKGKVMLPFRAVSSNPDTGVDTYTANEIIEAMMAMAKVRTGALILVQNSVGLGEHEQTGITVDAVVSRQLLINIFEDKTPLHDGAVIVRNNRIAAATCVLPLTQSPLAPELGTRHRAAVGASEVSDALCFVVSEETGNISAAREGKLFRDLSMGELREFFVESFGEDKKRLILWRGRHDKAKNPE